MKVVVCGSRGWTNQRAIRDVIYSLPAETTVIHGGARGADSVAGEWARRAGFVVKVFHANWDRFGRSAGMIRNIAMLDEKPDKVIAFWDGKSPGTKHTIREAEKRGIPVQVVTPALPEDSCDCDGCLSNG